MSESRSGTQILNPYAAPAGELTHGSFNGIPTAYRLFVIGWLAVATTAYCGFQVLNINSSDKDVAFYFLMNVPVLLLWIWKVASKGCGYLYGVSTLVFQVVLMIGILQFEGVKTLVVLLVQGVTLAAFGVPTFICWSWAMNAKTKSSGDRSLP